MARGKSHDEDIQAQAKALLLLDELVRQHLTTSLQAVVRIAQIVTDEEWIKRQNANDIAMLYGVLSDKAVHILGAAERAAAESGEGQPRSAAAADG